MTILVLGEELGWTTSSLTLDTDGSREVLESSGDILASLGDASWLGDVSWVGDVSWIGDISWNRYLGR